MGYIGWDYVEYSLELIIGSFSFGMHDQQKKKPRA